MFSEFMDEAKKLKNQYYFHAAIDLLDRIPDTHRDEKYYLLKAQCYYQDFQLPKQIRFDRAIALLDKIEDESNEKKRLYGAIYKRKYEYFKNKEHKEYLEKAIQYYEEAANDVDRDLGYGAGNAVYLYYLLLSDFPNTLTDDKKKEYEDKANELIDKSLTKLNSLEEKDAWNIASMSALYLSKGDVVKSKNYLEKYKSNFSNGIDRDQHITLEQLVKLYDVLPQNIKNNIDPKHTIHYLLKDVYLYHENIIESARYTHDKIGLALSGGGFRASLYHIGVLMRLAELDLLRQVEVISTVSGGSIIGMMYYLILKQEFYKGNNEEIDYKNLIQNLEYKFLEGIQKNIRMKAFDKKLKIPLTQKLGELYQEILYDTIEGDIPTLMNDIAITPKGFDSFNPHFHNFTLKNKVPRIIVNATLLNNGHNWQFTTEGMGENSYMYDRTIDKNASYPFKQYSKICGDITIGEAIASSSAVPTLFDPVAFDLLSDTEDCQTKVREGKLQICDGGVYDNLGLASLVNDECTHIIISDGSKQMTTDHEPSTFRLDVLNRTNDMLMTKNRDAEYRFANHLKNQGIVKGLAISHMKEDIEETKLAFLLNKVASIRTDLDAFNDVEAYAIMYSGYKITSMQFENEELKKSFDIKEGIPLADEFNTFELYYEKNQSKTLKMIDKSSKTLFKAITYVRLNLLWSICACLTLLMILWFYFFPKILLSFLILIFILFKIEKKWLKLGSNKILGVVMKCISRYYLKYINQKYLDSGKMK